MTAELPTAVAAPRRRSFGTFLLPLAALVVAVWLGVANWSGGGRLITVHADEGHGIEAGDPLRYRGIHVGAVEEVALESDLSGVRIALRLEPDAEALAREGSRFWVVRPHLGLDGVQGLETIVGARYLSVLPGPADGLPAEEFRALPEPPLAERFDADGLRLVLEAPSRFHLQPGAPVAYRQIQVGVVTDVALASDANAVEVGVYVRPDYARLVRANTRFWETGGVEIDLQLMEGLSVEMESLRSLLVGGIALATPETAGAEASSGDRFTLHADAEPEWLAWRPTLPVGPDVTREFAHAPLHAATLEWKDDGVLRRGRSRRGWIVPVGDGAIAGPADLLSPVADAREPGATLTVGERSAVLAADPEVAEDGLARRAWPLAGADAGARADLASWTPPTAPLGAPRDCYVLAGGDHALRGLAGAHLAAEGDAWVLDGDRNFGEDWHGALVLERATRAWIGVLLVDEDRVRVVPADGLAAR